MYEPENQTSELERFIKAAPSAIGSGVRSGFRGVALFLSSGLAFGTLIGKIELWFYEIPYIALGLWLLTGILIFRSCDRGDI